MVFVAGHLPKRMNFLRTTNKAESAWVALGDCLTFVIKLILYASNIHSFSKITYYWNYM